MNDKQRAKYEELQRKNKLNRLQVAAFQMLFKLRLPEVGIETAFASAIADTSDVCFRKAFEKRPDLVEKWVKEH